MQEEVTQKTIALVIKTAKLDANVLKAAMRMYLSHRRQKAQKTHGKTSVKKLVGEGVGVSSIEVTDGNIKSFERVARKYNVDFAVKKDKTTDPPKYVVFFKGRDADAVAQAFKEFVYGNEKRKGRTSVREKLKRFRDVDCQHFFRQIFLGYFSDIVQAFDTLRKNVCGDDYTSLHNPIVLSSVLPAYGMFHSIQILFL